MNFSINTFQLLYMCIFLFELFTCKKKMYAKEQNYFNNIISINGFMFSDG